VEEVLAKCLDNSAEEVVDTLKYAVEASEGVDKKFRGGALKVVGETIRKLLESGSISSGANRTACCLYVVTMQLLNEPEAVGQMLGTLLKEEEEGLLGLQLCFDIVDSGDRRFVDEVAKILPNPAGDGAEGGASDATTRLSQAHRILTTGFTSELHLSFLYKSSNSDPLIMINLKKALEERSSGLGGRNSILHNCAVTTNGYLNLGTTGDGFLRDNLEWMKKAANWYVLLFMCRWFRSATLVFCLFVICLDRFT
jgi:26S proteasome regulatory subunit N2